MPPCLDQDGFQTAAAFLTIAQIEALRSALVSRKIAPGRRDVMRSVRAIAELAGAPKISSLLEETLEKKCFPVRSIFFDKTPEANWLVPWHQDITVAVKERVELPGYGPWSSKEGVPHVQPPIEILENMVTVRLHLDDCDESNGALRVIPGSHRLGRLSAARIAEVRSREKEVVCSVQAGDAFLMRPLLLHASSQAIAPTHRRVIHLEYASGSLPEGLVWAETTVTQASKIPPESFAQNK
jgi:ectoine hydroxylase-related dioxygenase (phytanoyl-CoA dioxygenase family)